MSFIASFELLVERAWAGDEKAFRELYHLLHQYLRNFMGNYDAASDVAQETLLLAWQKRSQVRDPSKLKSWIFNIAHNKAIDYIRREKQQTSHSLDALEDQDTSEINDYLRVTRLEELPEEYLESKENKKVVQLALAQVSEECRSCVVLFIIQKAKQGEIADLYNCSTRTVQRRIVQGLEELRRNYYQLVHGTDTERSSGQ